MSASGSIIVGTVVLLLLTALTVGCVVALRSLGFDRNHPWVQLVRTRPWRSGEDVVRIALRRLSQALIIAPNGSRVAPNYLELRMNPDDLFALAESLDMEFINSSATEVYQEMLSKGGIRTSHEGPVQVSVVGDPAVPIGRYDLGSARLRKPSLLAGWDLKWQSGGQAPGGGETRLEGATDYATLRTPASFPSLRLITGGRVAETSVSGARAGRSRKLEFTLPADPAVSRVHAEFTYDQGQWWITNLGRNGIVLNGDSIYTKHALQAGDSIRWGRRSTPPRRRLRSTGRRGRPREDMIRPRR